MKSSYFLTIACSIACCIILNNAQVQDPPAPDPASVQPVIPAQAQPVNPSPVQSENPVPVQPANPAPVQPANPAPVQPANPVPAQPVNPVPVQPANPVPAQPVNPAPVQPVNPVPVQPANPVPAQPVNPAPVQPVNPAPVQPANPVPAQGANPVPVQPVNPAPVQPVNPVPVQPVNPAPVQPADPIPVQPANPAPVQPVDPAPVQPANPVPVQPVNPAPVQPVNPVPVQPANPAPVQPVNPAPVQPVDSASVPVQSGDPVPVQPVDQSQPQPVNPDEVQPADPAQPVNPVTPEPVTILTKMDGVCAICSCPSALTQNPYVINCSSLDLNETQVWGQVFLEVDNVHLLLQHNKFERISAIAKCDSLDALDFSYNAISDIDDSAFANVAGLKQLLLAHNKLSHISTGAFHSEGLPLDIEILDLSYNQINSLHNDAFDQLPNLKKLVLQGNPFHALDSATLTALNNLKMLEELNLAATFLTELPRMLINPIRHLQILNLADNQFNTVPEILQGSQLSELIFSGNLIVELLPSSFIEMGKLQVLEVNRCPKLTAIRKGTLFPLTSLKTFRCNDNSQLRLIERRAFRDENGEGPQVMETIELRNNSLATLSEDLFKHIGLVINDTLDPSDNPFNCSCHLAWLTREGPAFKYLRSIKCAAPPEFRGQSLAEVDFTTNGQLPCPNPHDEDVEAHFTYVVSESYGFWIFVMIIGLIIIISVSFYVIRSKPQLRYSILKIVTPSKVQYREEESAKVKYTRQYNEDYEDPFNGLDMDLEIYKR